MWIQQSQIRHISYAELDAMLRELAYRLRDVKGIKPQTARDQIPAAILAHFLKVPLGSGTEFSIYSDSTTEVCLFKKEYESDLLNRSVKHYMETVNVDEEGRFTQITFEWEKL